MNLSTLNPNELVGPSGRNVQSAYFDGTDDYLTAPDNAAFDFGTGDFTIEAWVYIAGNSSLNSNSTREATVFASFPTTTPTPGTLTNAWGINISGNGTTTGTGISFSNWQAGAQSVVSATVTIPQASWNHIAVARSGTTTKLFLNGAEVGSGTLSNQTVNSGQNLAIGRLGFPGYIQQLNGYIANLRVLKGTALYTSNFTPPTAPLTPIANTSFLLGFSPYQFIDQSPNNFTITRNGDTTQSTFGPYGNNWSNYFDGTGDYLSIGSNAAFDFGTGNFTIEAWVCIVRNSILDGNGNRPGVIFAVADSTYSASFIIDGSPSTTGTGLILYGPAYASVAGTINQNIWNHLAVSKSGTSVYFWLNGAQLGATQTVSGSWGSSTKQVQIGQSLPGNYTFPLNGYISNLRVLKGTALYTSAFTPPTAPLPVIPNTSLLTCQSNRFLDASSNNFAITRNGDVSVQPYVPFPANWSNYFDGAGDYLRVGYSSAFDLSSGDFTIEGWFYSNSFLAPFNVIAKDTAGQNFDWAILITSPTTIIWYTAGTAQNLTATVPAMSVGAWYHVAYVRSSGTNRIYLNGVSYAQNTMSITNASQVAVTIGCNGQNSPQNFINGYISNLRLVKGTAVYTSNFTPPTTPLTAIPNTVLLTCRSSSFTDFSSNNFTITPNGNVSAQFYGPFSGPVPEPVVDVYTNTASVNTWIKRPGAKAVQMIAIGAGGGGGGGAASSTNLSRTGGAGGGGGANGQIIYTADQLPATLYIRVGASGTSGASATAGGAGGNSTVAAADPITSSTSIYCMGGGGGGGKGGGDQLITVGGGGGGTAGAGTTGTGTTAVSGGLPAISVSDNICGGGGNGAANDTTLAGRAEWGGAGGGSTRQFGNISLVGGSSLYGGGGGGQGGSMGSYQPTPAVFVGTAGGNSGLYINSTSYAPPAGAAASTPANGSAGANATTLYAAGHGGGGGYPNVSGGAGYAGGAGGFPGGGGGGGGASEVAGAGGVGGAGGAGRVVLITFF